MDTLKTTLSAHLQLLSHWAMDFRSAQRTLICFEDDDFPIVFISDLTDLIHLIKSWCTGRTWWQVLVVIIDVMQGGVVLTAETGPVYQFSCGETGAVLSETDNFHANTKMSQTFRKPQLVRLWGCVKMMIKTWEKVANMMTGWWFGTFFIFPHIENNHPNWLIFFRGVDTTN